MAHTSKDGLLALIRDGKSMTLRQQLLLTASLSVPAIMAQLSSIIMQYIDASMVGSLGANDSASIGLVSTTLWLFGGICSAVTTGFTVQVAHLLGAKKNEQARHVLRQSMVVCLLFGLLIVAVGAAISGPLPHWLGGHEDIIPAASTYFLIFVIGLPLLTIDFLASGMLRSSGNMKVPSLLNIVMCVLDVAFNFLLIFPTRELTIAGFSFTMPGAGLGVKGAAIGTITAEAIIAVAMLWYLLTRSPELRLGQDSRCSYRPTSQCLGKAWHIGMPMGVQHTLMCSAQIIITAIVAPLGSIALAANTFAITAESLCYMPGYGISEAATTLVGQSIGAARRELARQFARITVGLGMAVMTFMGILMYVGAPLMMGIMSPVEQVVALGTHVLRIEAWAEPFFAAAIVSYGVFVGAGDTLVPCGMNLFSMWAVRLTLAAMLVGTMGLVGVWTAMAVELTFRGCIYLVRLHSDRWIKVYEQGS